MKLNRRESLVAIVGMVCLPSSQWFGSKQGAGRQCTEVGVSFDEENWYWASVPGNHGNLDVDWCAIGTDAETGKLLVGKIAFVGLGIFPLRKGEKP
ncbi:hypothetical protein LCGC14_0325920 [marine sediment metagenome]|uniref:Uncharacterized protein n=1 Tax=marine sediment metagenome TaxID=412755 RepID=A0A0F9W558_9ZZZZ